MSLDLQRYGGQLVDTTVAFAPKLLAAIVILVIAYIIAKILSWAVAYAADRTSIGKQATSSGSSIGASLAKAVFWVVMLIATPAILGALGMESIVAPLQEMADKFLAFLPNLFGAGIILLIGGIVATVARTAITSILEAVQVDSWAERAGLTSMASAGSIARAIGTFVFAIIIIPVVISALDALQVASIADPAKEMLSSFLAALPNIIGAGIVLTLAFIIGKFATNTLKSILPATGVDNVGKNATVQAFIGKGRNASDLIAQIAFIAILLFGAIEAAKLLQFAVLSDIMATLLALGGKILMGTLIIGFGVFAANVVANIVSNTTPKSSPLPSLIRVVIIILTSAMGLQQMGLANDIVTLGFSLMMGAIALGGAIAIGLGGQDAAKTLLNKWSKKL